MIQNYNIQEAVLALFITELRRYVVTGQVTGKLFNAASLRTIV